MMKYCFMLIFMVKFWLNQYIYFMLMYMFMLSFSYNYMYKNISYFLGCDLLSYCMILLSLWICSLMPMASESVFYKNYYCNMFMLIVLILLFSLFITFSSLYLFLFYLFFEMSLIPTLMVIVGWGYQPDGLQAGYYLMFYTLLASLPMMISIFYYYEKFNSLDFFLCLM